MKNIVIAFVLIAFVGCNEESPTENKLTNQQKYTIEELESNSDWVEVTDIDTLELPCIWLDVFEMGEISRTDDEYKALYKESKLLDMGYEMPYCDKDTDFIDLDFSTRSLILFEVRSNGGSPLLERRIFKNSKLNQYRYILEITKRSGTEENSGFTEVISIPKVSSNSNVMFDTLMYYNY
ncbi:MAG: hypothetical protein WC121_14465 [Candidatus Kapaibacterium sp.]|jgi:hypothetical protein